MIRIRPLGPSYSVKSVAEALHPFHPTYYFLIDRDYHHNDDFVGRCWDNFPDPATHNLLVWRYREIENYFLEPDYLAYSDFLDSQMLLSSAPGTRHLPGCIMLRHSKFSKAMLLPRLTKMISNIVLTTF